MHNHTTGGSVKVNENQTAKFYLKPNAIKQMKKAYFYPLYHPYRGNLRRLLSVYFERQAFCADNYHHE